MGLGSEVNKSKQVAFDSPENKNDQTVSDCPICLDLLANKDDERSLVKLRCGHEFHLDCIGSAFNAKNKMECPLCRQIEKGQWLYAQPQHNNPPILEFNVDDWIADLEFPPYLQLMDALPTSDVWREFVLPSDRILPNSAWSTSFAPNQIYDNGFTRFDIWGREYSFHESIAHQREENLARLLHGLGYGYDGISGGTSTEHGESSGGEVVTGDMVETITTVNNGDISINDGCDCGCEDYEQF